MAPRATKDTWQERLLAWRRSGLSPEDFARGQPFQASTLRWWASRLRPPTSPRFVAVVTPAPVAPTTPLVVSVGDARIQIERGFDPALLAAVVAALGGAR